MNSELSTNDIRGMLEEMGAVKPGLPAVAMIARETGVGTRRWILNYPETIIQAAVKACEGKRGELSYSAFAQALKQPALIEQ